MRISIKKEKRNSIAYYLSPQELTIALPESLPATSAKSLQSTVLKPTADFDCNGSITRRELRKMLNTWKNKLEVRPNGVQVTKLRNKWASCSSSRSIVFNENLQNMPKEFTEYVICHEFLHLKVRRHNKLFKSLLSAYMPDWQERLTRTIEGVLGNRIEASV